jgi:hypothetical protein
MPGLDLQPKQSQLYSLVLGRNLFPAHHWTPRELVAPVVGIYGGRGSAKSSGLDRVLIGLMDEIKGLTCCLIMRTWVKQMVPFHLERIKSDFPWAAKDLKASPPAMLRRGTSRMDFKYAENYDAVIEAFRSGNYDIIAIDQAEQFTGREIREMRKACRSAGGRVAKAILSFNMRGSSIQELRKWFYLHEVNKDEDPEDYVSIRMNPWDNVEWVRAALREDGYSVREYYSWTDEQRKSYAARRGPYTRQLATDDEVIRKADWEGDWDSLEGSYFANSFDLESTRIAPSLVESLRKSWAVHWYAQDWGKAHWCATLWAFKIALKPSEAKALLDWDLIKPINITCLYREMIVNEREAPDVAQDIVDSTPQEERAKHKAYFLSPEEVTGDPNSIGSQQAKVLRKNGMPGPLKADNDRKGGWGLMGALFKANKGRGWGVDKDGNRFQYDDALLVSSECPEFLNAIPALLRDPKNLDDVLKTDLSTAKIEQDIGDAGRYLVKSMLAPKAKPEEEEFRETMNAASASARMMLTFRREQTKAKPKRQVLPPSWKSNLR